MKGIMDRPRSAFLSAQWRRTRRGSLRGSWTFSRQRISDVEEIDDISQERVFERIEQMVDFLGMK